MTPRSSTFYVLSLSAAVMLLAGCVQARIYVADQGYSKVLIFSESDGKQIGSITDGVNHPYGLYVDRQGNLYVANEGNNTVTAYPPGSRSPSITWSQDLDNPHYPVVDAKGDLFVSNQGNGTVVEYLSGNASTYQVLQTAGAQTDGLDFDSQGNLYVAYRKDDNIQSGASKNFPRARHRVGFFRSH